MAASPQDAVDELVGAAEAARRLGLSGERVRQLAHAGELPLTAGRVGRQEVWRWRDLQGWAAATGRFAAEVGTGARQTVRAFAAPEGRLRRVVDEVMPWGHRLQSTVHVRIWEPLDSQDEPAVVLLGNLEDNRGRSVTNSIEEVAMLVGARFLGPRAQQAQYYEHWSRGTIDGRPTFHHVTFIVRRTQRRASPHLRAIGAELAEPDWRRASREEIERLVGETLDVYTPGTYTAELVRAVHENSDGAVEVVWDPDGARRAADAWRRLRRRNAALELPAEELSITLAALARHAVTAREDAARHTVWQDPDAPVRLLVPDLDEVESLREAAAEAVHLLEDHQAVWRSLGRVRTILAATSEDDRCELVPALPGGLTRLTWWEAAVPEREPPGHGPLGPFATLDTACDTAMDVEPVRLWRTAESALMAFLSGSADEYPSWETPCYRPAGPLSATGPTVRRYLADVQWGHVEAEDTHRLARLKRFADDALPPRHGDDAYGYDVQGHLVLLGSDRKQFWAEWPVVDAGRFAIPDAVVRADAKRRPGAAPVFLELPDGALSLLPSAGGLGDYHDYTWGYYGTGPTNLSHALVNVVLAATNRRLNKTTLKRLRDVIRKRVASGRTPAWRLGELLEEASRSESG